MTIVPLRKFDLSDPQDWSIRLEQQPIIFDGRPDFHYALLMVREGPGMPRVLHEIHGRDVDLDNYKPDPTNLTGPALLTAVAGLSPFYRPYLAQQTTIEVQDRPNKILHLWNNAMRAALAIRSLKRPFELPDYECKTVVEAVLDSIGLRSCPDVKLASEIGAHRPGPQMPDAATLLGNFADLCSRLPAPRIRPNAPQQG